MQTEAAWTPRPEPGRAMLACLGRGGSLDFLPEGFNEVPAPRAPAPPPRRHAGPTTVGLRGPEGVGVAGTARESESGDPAEGRALPSRAATSPPAHLRAE